VSAALVADAGWSLDTRRAQATLSAASIAATIAGIVLLVSIVDGVNRFALEHVRSAGGNVIVVTPNPASSPTRNLPSTLRIGDERVVVASTSAFDLASAENVVTATVSAGERTLSGREVRGLSPDGFAVLRLRPAAGRLLIADEYALGTRAVVLGPALARRLFPGSSPLGQLMTIGPWPFTVVGVLAWTGEPNGSLRSGLDETLFVPFRAAADAFLGSDAVSSLRFRLREPANEEAAIQQAQAVLDRQRLQRGETGGDLRITNTFEQMRFFERVTTLLRVLVGLVGAIGFVIGAVGIANALFASVRERTVEIGVRRAFGATRGDIFGGFLLESLAITVSGGLVGLLMAFAVGRMTTLLPQIPPIARPEVSGATSLAVVALLVIVGLFAGVAPARNAASIYPAEALRAE
jgi:putative ABC transport system permease protein